MIRKTPADARQRQQALRVRAKALLDTQQADLSALPAHDVQALVQELHVHQIELELQNEELLQAQVDLAHARDRYADLYEFAPVGYLMLDAAGTIAEANLTAAALLGVERRALVQAPLTRFVARAAQDDFYRHRQAVFASDDKQTVDLAMRTADDKPLVVHLESIAFGALPARQCRTALVDVTARHRAEQALRAATTAAEQADAIKTRFLAAASHDLRQPLQALGMYLSALARQLDRPQQQAIGDKMRASLATMTDLIAQLFALSQLETGAIEPVLRAVRTQPLLAQVLAGYQAQARAKGVALTLTGTNCVVHSDPDLLRQVLSNLIANAIQYTDHGHVTVSCERGAAGVRIAFSDTGKGIPEAELERIFDVYYQIDNPARERRLGYGVGLAIVKRIVDALDHRLAVRSILGQGSTFTLEVPLGHDAYPDNNALVAPATR